MSRGYAHLEAVDSVLPHVQPARGHGHASNNLQGVVVANLAVLVAINNGCKNDVERVLEGDWDVQV